MPILIDGFTPKGTPRRLEVARNGERISFWIFPQNSTNLTSGWHFVGRVDQFRESLDGHFLGSSEGEDEWGGRRSVERQMDVRIKDNRAVIDIHNPSYGTSWVIDAPLVQLRQAMTDLLG